MDVFIGGDPFAEVPLSCFLPWIPADQHDQHIGVDDDRHAGVDRPSSSSRLSRTNCTAST